MASDLDLVKLWTYLRWRNPAPRSRIKIFQISSQNIYKNLKKKVPKPKPDQTWSNQNTNLRLILLERKTKNRTNYSYYIIIWYNLVYLCDQIMYIQ